MLPAALQPYIMILDLVPVFLCHTISADVVLLGMLASFARDGFSCISAPVNCACSFRSFKNCWFVIVTLSFFFHSGLRCALVGRALTCALPRLFVLPLFVAFSCLLVRVAMFCLCSVLVNFHFFHPNLCLGLSQLVQRLAWPFDL